MYHTGKPTIHACKNLNFKENKTWYSTAPFQTAWEYLLQIHVTLCGLTFTFVSPPRREGTQLDTALSNLGGQPYSEQEAVAETSQPQSVWDFSTGRDIGSQGNFMNTVSKQRDHPKSDQQYGVLSSLQQISFHPKLSRNKAYMGFALF